MNWLWRARSENPVEFPPDGDHCLIYALEVDTDLSAVAADYKEGKLIVRLPRSQAREWIETERIGVDGQQALGHGRVLRILVEKDFQCLHAENGQIESGIDREAYPNPLADVNRQEAG